MAQNNEIQKGEKTAVALNEERVLAWWQEQSIFEKSLKKNEGKDEFVFYDGPPFATGLPHYGHLIPGTIKDIIPRYKTMRGYYVRRQWGWDCHGLPIENLIEKELDLKSKKDIEAYGVEKFNAAARASVLRYAEDWRKIIPRTGRFINMDDDYRTMDASYSESVWWAFQTLYDKKLAYEGFKVMPYCPHCGTTLSNFEVNQGYKDITDISVYAKFKLSGQENTFFIAWTTTPWTLPGNVALAVNPKVDYVKIKMKDAATQAEVFYILAKARLAVVKEAYEIVETVKGEKLLGLSYEPVFDYYKNVEMENKAQAWKVYAGDFVTTEDGSGIVHIAPAFGGDDYELSVREKLPVIVHVAKDGTFKEEVADFRGQAVKPKEDHQKGDVEIIKNLAHRGLLFAKEKIVHSYPHCWRCDTPLLNYAATSWFVKVTAIKDTMLKENAQVNWTPEHIKEGRFGKWLEGAKDWAISRSRYWGAPLPVWKCDECEEIAVLGSIAELEEKIGKRNTYFALRHGEGEHNLTNLVSTRVDNPHHLTEKGKGEVRDAALKLKDRAIDVIYASDFIRTRETAEIVASVLSIPKEKIIYDTRLREIKAGVLEGKKFSEYHAFFKTHAERFTKKPEGGETVQEVKNRGGAFLYEIDAKNEGKNILIIGHDDPLFYMRCAAKGLVPKEILALPDEDGDSLHTGEVKAFSFVQIPHNENYEIDLHRPYIDEVVFACACKKGKMKRIADVFDTWFDSGSMTFARHHYPFGDKKLFNPKGGLFHKSVGFPADFIAEGSDQTRGWFYTLLVLSVGLFDKAPFKNVVVNGVLLAEDGRKMAKKLKNYPELSTILDKYGADALRYFLMASPLVHAEDVSFSEKAVDEIYKKMILRLNNVVSFYEMFADEGQQAEQVNKENSKTSLDQWNSTTRKNILDVWIIARLKQVVFEMTEGLEHYTIDKAVWPLDAFIDDLSTWYIRRSRDRFKAEEGEDKQAALSTLRFVLQEFSKLLAPVMPFIAETIFQKVREKSDVESVNLAVWPETKPDTQDEAVIADMKEVRNVVTLGLEARFKAGIKVRQPLAKLTLKKALAPAMAELVKDEVNVKEIAQDNTLDTPVLLDTTLTESLRAEGYYRDLVRAVQDLRKKENLVASDRVTLTIDTDEAGKKIVEDFKSEIIKITGLSALTFKDLTDGEKGVELLKIETMSFKLCITK